ncbi:MAG: hypothetical protein LBT30_02770 [Clostridiales bacterium]|jgi:xanthine/uracil permease|nr:hypothetical protein [Clostridiales bacterium]
MNTKEQKIILSILLYTFFVSAIVFGIFLFFAFSIGGSAGGVLGILATLGLIVLAVSTFINILRKKSTFVNCISAYSAFFIVGLLTIITSASYGYAALVLCFAPVVLIILMLLTSNALSKVQKEEAAEQAADSEKSRSEIDKPL